MAKTNTISIDGRSALVWGRSRGFWARLYVATLAVLAFCLLGWIVYSQIRARSENLEMSFSWYGFVLLLLVGAFAEKYTVRIGSGQEVSAAFLAFFLGAAIIGPLASFLIAAASQLPLLRRNDLERTSCFASVLALVAAGTALFYSGLMGSLSDHGDNSAVSVAAVGLAAGVFFQILNYLLFVPVGWLRRGLSPVKVWREGFQPFIPFHFFFLAISLGLIYIYRAYALKPGGVSQVYSTLLIMLCLLPVLGLIYAFRAFAHERELSRHNAALALRNERLFLQAVKSQVTALDVKDNYTARHSAAVARWATDIAQAMALSKHDQNITHLASLVHDVGKIGVPDEVLNFPGKLEHDAWLLVETHCQNGHKILKTIDQFGELAEVILYHHERYDGSGYPVGLVGEAIPLISRIICVADSYSAMVSDRPYRKALSAEIAQGELRKHSGKQFDPALVDVFLKVLAEHDLAYQRGELADFDLEFSSDRFLRELPAELVDEEPGLAAPVPNS